MPVLCCGAPSVRDGEGDARGATTPFMLHGRTPVAEEVDIRKHAARQLDPDEERRQQSAEAGPASALGGFGVRWVPGKSGGSARKVVPLPASPTNSLLMQSGVRMTAMGHSQEDSSSQREQVVELGADSHTATSSDALFALGNHPFGVHHAASASSGHGGGRPLTVEELEQLGFPCYSSLNLPPSSTQLPVALLVLETLDEGSSTVPKPSHGGYTDQEGPSVRKPANNLVPLYINSACGAYFSISSHKDYVSVIRKLLQRDPLLTFALQKALKNLKTGEAKPVSHVTPDPSGQTSTLFGMRISPCVWEDLHITSASGLGSQGGGARTSGLSTVSYAGPVTQLAALLVEHNMPYNAAEVMPRLMRDYAVLSHVPAILTLIDFQGKVLYQNASSLAYMGDLLSVKYDNHLSDGLLRLLFMYDINNLEQMLEEVLHGQEWQGVVQVPGSMRRFLAAANHAASAAHHSASNQPSTVNGSFSARHHDDLEVEFQIGNSFTTRGLASKHRKAQHKQAAAGFMINRASALQAGVLAPANAGRNLTVAVPNGANGMASGPSLTNMGQRLGVSNQSMPSVAEDSYPHPHSGASVGAAEQPNQRRFMSLLDKTTTPRPSTTTLHRVSSLQQDPNTTSESSATPTGAGGLDSRLSSDAPQQQPVAANGMPLSPPLLGGYAGAATEATDSPPAGMGTVAGGDYEEEDDYQENIECYHEIHAIPLLDPVLDKQVIMLVQTDVTPRVELENKLADLTDAQLSMLEQLFPRHIIEYMLAGVPSKGGRNLRDLANTHEQVMVLFCDVVGFTSMSKEVEPSQVMHFLNELYEAFDALADDYDMYKLDIVGDCYIVVAGLIKEDQDGFVCVDEMDSEQVVHNAERIMEFAKAMLRESRPVLMPHNLEPVQLRIGIHTGPLVSGLVGAKMPKFTLFGDTMNTASRMESTCKPGCVHVSDAFAQMLPGEVWQPTGGVQVKGKGLMQTCLHVPSELPPNRQASEHDFMKKASGGLGMSRMASFPHSRNSPRSSVDQVSEPGVSGTVALRDGSRGHHPNQPLLTILTNIMGGAEEDGMPSSPGNTASDAMLLGSIGAGGGKGLGTTFTSRYPRGTIQYGRASGDGGELEGKRLSEGLGRHVRRPSEGFSLLLPRDSTPRDSSGLGRESMTGGRGGRRPSEGLRIVTTNTLRRPSLAAHMHQGQGSAPQAPVRAEDSSADEEPAVPMAV